MKTFWIVYEVDGDTAWQKIKAENAEQARELMTRELVSQGYQESLIIIWEVSEAK